MTVILASILTMLRGLRGMEPKWSAAFERAEPCSCVVFMPFFRYDDCRRTRNSRRRSRARKVRGSVGIASATDYPRISPAVDLIGRTPLRLFDVIASLPRFSQAGTASVFGNFGEDLTAFSMNFSSPRLLAPSRPGAPAIASVISSGAPGFCAPVGNRLFARGLSRGLERRCESAPWL